MLSRELTPTDISKEVSSDLESTGTIWRPPLACDLLNGESDTAEFKAPTSKLRRYDATSQLSVYSEEGTTSVPKQPSINGQDLAQNSIGTRSATDNHDTISNNCTDKSEKSSSAGSKLISGDNAQKQTPSRARLWLADTPEMFYVVDSKAIPSHLSASTNSGLARIKRYDGTSQLGALLKKENVAISVDNLAPRLKRYDATSELSLYKNKNASVLKQTSSNAQSPDEISPRTISSNNVAPKMRRYDATSELSLYKQQGARSVLKQTLSKEGCTIQSFSETGSSTHIASKMRRYDATSELSLYKKQETTSVLEQTSSDAHFAATVVKNCTTNECVANSKFDNGHELSTPESKEAGPSDQLVSHGIVSNGQDKAQPPTNARYWFEENPEAFDAIERVQSANGSDSSDATENIASVECEGRSKLPERKKTGLFGCWRVPLLKKHKKKQTCSDGPNGDQASTVAISTTGNTLVTLEPVDTVEPANPPLTTLRECSTFFRVPYNPISPAKPHEIEAARIRMEAFLAKKALSDASDELARANNVTTSSKREVQKEVVSSQVYKTETLPTSSSSSNNGFPMPTNPQDQKQKAQPIIPKFVWRPNEQISPASKKDLANAEKRLQMYFASKNLPMPGGNPTFVVSSVAPSSSVKSTAKGAVGSAEDLKKIFGL